MSEVLVIARLRVMATDVQLQSYHDRVAQLEPNVEGMSGFSFWRSFDGDGGLLQLMRYKDAEVADRALDALVHSKIGPLVASVTIDPPDVVLVTPRNQNGRQHDQVPLGSFGTTAFRFADPGLAEDMEQDTDEVLSELAFIPGFLGSIWGVNVALADEIVSMCYWNSDKAMMDSIPTSHKVKIQKWQKAV